MYQPIEETLKWAEYARKSSEPKERQVLSIRDQLTENAIVRERLAIKLAIEPITEEKSAFKPNKRPKLQELIRLIESGDINAIIIWKLDRLCRNPEEGGKIIQLLQDGKIKQIRTSDSTDAYYPESDTMILQFHFGMANQFSRTLSQNVRRGLRRKVHDRKQYPRFAPLGYENCGELLQRNIRPSVINGHFIKKGFNIAATGLYSLSQIGDILYNDGLRNSKGGRVSKGHIEAILKNPVYCGFFRFHGELCEGDYEPLISKALFDLVQEKLKDRSKPKQIIWNREFIKMFRCGECGCQITTHNRKNV